MIDFLSKKNIHDNLWIAAIFIACTLEVWLISFGKKELGLSISPLVAFGSGMFSGIGFLIFFYKKEVRFPSFKMDRKRGALLLLLFVIAAWNSTAVLGNYIEIIPVDFYDLASTGSDIIPQIGILVKRFLSGVFPYAPITDWEYDLYPTYLPFTWMPFIIPDLLGVDYRWMALVILMLGIFICLKKISSWNQGWIETVLFLLVAFGYLYAFQKEDNAGIFRYSVETMIAGYYLMLATSIFSKSNLWRASTIILCLLSRYAIVFWVPLFLMVIFFREKKSNAIKIGAMVLGGILIFYVLPFLSQDFSIFINGYNYHTNAAPLAWNTYPWQSEEVPTLIFSGLGLAGSFYQIIEGTGNEKLHLFRILHLVMTLLTVAISIFVFFKIKYKIDYRVFLLGTLKIYLVVFYNFIQMPFNYLFLTMIIISLPMLGLLLNKKIYG